jgi:hypothetical protein
MSKTREIAGAAVIAALLASAAAPAQAGFFERLFGGFTRHVLPPVTRSPPPMTPLPGDRVSPQGKDDWRPRSDSNGPRIAYCVRTCDGSYFPMHPHAGFSASEMCKTFCPGSDTKVYVGSGIDHAATPEGRRYTELANAYAYRKHLVSGCTCNGRNIFGVARITPESDPTLQRGDLVATRDGMMAVSGMTAQGPQLTAAADYRGIPQREREQLSQTRVAKPGAGRAAITEGRGARDE